MAYELRKEDLEPLLLGAAFFGSGGGGRLPPSSQGPMFCAGTWKLIDALTAE